MTPSGKTFKDEVDKISIEQLHQAVLQISEACYDIKKLCATILASVPAVVAAFAEIQVGPPLFFFGSVVVSFFWFLDAQNYYYQRKIRARMKELADNMAARNEIGMIIDGIGMPISANRNRKWARARDLLSSAFNGSMVFYYLLMLSFTAVAAMQMLGILPIITLSKP